MAGRSTNGTRAAALDYDLNRRTRLSGEIHANQPTSTSASTTCGSQGFGHAGGRTSEVFDQSGLNKSVRGNRAASASWRHSAGDDHDLSVSLSRERPTSAARPSSRDRPASRPRRTCSRISAAQQPDLTDLQGRLRRPLADDAKLKAGYDLRIDDNSYDNVGLSGNRGGERRAATRR